ncbi:sigma-70 family RNA polymerase sigma factor [Eubacteriales bacterium OttesenSCG-928-N14]|nr:sigma-70 family RNA polymerase sigma factor [Eubacteriales bacterium OttesenSCG-928-N14]
MANEHAIVERVNAAKGDSLAADAMIRDYMPFIQSETSKALGRLPVAGRDDEMSIAMIGFHQAIQTYNSSRGAFFKYAARVMRSRIIDYQRSETRHFGHASLDADSGEGTLLDTLGSEDAEHEQDAQRSATQEEIAELVAQLNDFGLTLSDIADNCPQQQRTLLACQQVLLYAKHHPEVIQELLRTKRLPLATLVEHTGVERKTLERHRKYILSLMIIHSNGFEIIRGHIKQIFNRQGGDGQ